jgi:hypothetical protein
MPHAITEADAPILADDAPGPVAVLARHRTMAPRMNPVTADAAISARIWPVPKIMSHSVLGFARAAQFDRRRVLFRRPRS